MGFLDHSTNNIIVDAVLTDEGRRRLALNNGSFRISMFSLGDDEIDYGIISKFGRVVGKEKIVKNTPVFEAQTHKDYAMKNRLITLADPTVRFMPNFEVTVATAAYSAATNLITFSRNTSSATITLRQQIAGNANQAIPEGLSDNSFTLKIPSRFLSVQNGGPYSLLDVTPNTRIATHKVIAAGREDNNGARVVIQLNKNSISNTDYAVFGTPPNNNEIDSVITIIGDQSGIRTDFNIKIQQ